jgi:hypothetical protein
MPEQLEAALPQSQPSSELIALQRLELLHRTRIAARAQWFALAALAMTLSAIVALALTSHDTVAGIVAGSVIVPVVGLYITARYPKMQEITSGSGASKRNRVIEVPQE